MGNGQAGVERRGAQRFLVNERAIAVLKVGSSFVRLGRIVHVSRVGLAFDYLLLDGNRSSRTKPDDDEVGEISLNIITEDGFMVLDGVAVRPVNDRLLQREELAFAAVPTRRCGVCFDNLSPVQHEQLGKFLLQRTVPSLYSLD